MLVESENYDAVLTVSTACSDMQFDTLWHGHATGTKQNV